MKQVEPPEWRACRERTETEERGVEESVTRRMLEKVTGFFIRSRDAKPTPIR
jgi:hypothetical protein